MLLTGLVMSISVAVILGMVIDGDGMMAILPLHYSPVKKDITALIVSAELENIRRFSLLR